MIPALALILCFQLLGETISRGLGLTLPGPVIGLVLLVVAGVLRPRLIEFLRPAASGLLANLSLFFVPAGVGIVAHLGQFRDHAFALGVALVVSTVLAIAAGALVFTWVAKLTGQSEEPPE
ncbi:CidA/LrgA family protein [Paracoccus aminophilus]|uniref:LrgA family protein n=1 Tax=Paracoccus aminophilus JCM 7686 TaxID=1367847 RepID=S5YFS9_PARAH|nr:CidA/LrgA family protein [Paracoccus aminophilus]AGT10333.1 LrgA family protein [Paracoccus aminophilus JCM 7686]